MKYTLLLAVVGLLFVASPALAHPGNTAADGCHYCRTNCSSWGVPWNTRHCHRRYSYSPPVYSSYAYQEPSPTPTPSYYRLYTNNAPLDVENAFKSIFGKKPTVKESNYWKSRIRDGIKVPGGYSKKYIEYWGQLVGAMQHHKNKGLTMPGGKM
jgi:hypothetical protein